MSKHPKNKVEAEQSHTEEPHTAEEDITHTSPDAPATDAKQPWYQRWQWTLTHKKFSIPITAVVLLGALSAVPFTRYLLAGTVLQQSFSVAIVDTESSKRG